MVTIPSRSIRATFAVATRKVTRSKAVRLSALCGGRTITATVLLLQTDSPAWYVAPNGTATGQGTITSPWDLQTALNGGPSGTNVKPGDIIWLRGGTYIASAKTFYCSLAGTASAPIIVRGYPGERAVIDKNGATKDSGGPMPALRVANPFVWFWGFEIINSDPNRSRTSPYTGTTYSWRGAGVDVYAPSVRFINMILHDNGHGIWDKESDTEVHGCLIYNNGNAKFDHGLYIGNKTGTTRITDNIIFSQGGWGVHAYAGSTSSSLSGLQIEGNAIFNNGILCLDDLIGGQILLGGENGIPADRITVKQNYLYYPSSLAEQVGDDAGVCGPEQQRPEAGGQLHREHRAAAGALLAVDRLQWQHHLLPGQQHGTQSTPACRPLGLPVELQQLHHRSCRRTEVHAGKRRP